ncbi:MAG: hypothetical protein A3B41_02915 [Candidatus Levybacteria bacterium RIFCSPLOWO2_01_FULL_37_26]|nr:MAG: hypothetical protein A3B41_02915 [Candidatus Levybacteria bacterium RIFCSPLOWO2_01_FULL_37_26]
MKTNWQVKKSELIRLIVELFVLILLLLILIEILFPDAISGINLVVLTATLIVLVWYAYDTHRIADQTIEANLRPVILRSGYIHSWKDIKFEYRDNKIENGKPIQFTILKNIAKDIQGYIIIDGYKYRLLFGNEISKVSEEGSWLSQTWGWMKPETSIYAAFLDKNKEKAKEKNKIYIEYKDIEDNTYFTIEDENFCQKSFKT